MKYSKLQKTGADRVSGRVTVETLPCHRHPGQVGPTE